MRPSIRRRANRSASSCGPRGVTWSAFGLKTMDWAFRRKTPSGSSSLFSASRKAATRLNQAPVWDWQFVAASSARKMAGSGPSNEPAVGPPLNSHCPSLRSAGCGGNCVRTTILIADDEAPMRKYISTNLKVRGYDVLVAADGIEALKLAGEHNLDLVLLDIGMPGPDRTQ